MTGATGYTPRYGALGVVFVGALLWGVYWIPVRLLEDVGLPGIWAGFSLSVTAFLTAWILYLVRGEQRGDWIQISAAFFVGVAFAFYGAAISYTDVVRAILLFYLTPVWSMLIECMFFGRRWTWQSSLAILAAFGGIICIFRGGLPLEGIGALGDWLSLAAGVAWSVASALLYSRGQMSPLSLATWALGATMLVSGVIVLLLGASVVSVWAAPAFEALKVSGTTVAFGSLYVVPVMLLTLWGTTQFSAVTMGFLLTGEIISGVATSALLLGEPFGWPEMIGTVLIVLGASIEILVPQRRGTRQTRTEAS